MSVLERISERERALMGTGMCMGGAHNQALREACSGVKPGDKHAGNPIVSRAAELQSDGLAYLPAYQRAADEYRAGALTANGVNYRERIEAHALALRKRGVQYAQSFDRAIEAFCGEGRAQSTFTRQD